MRATLPCICAFDERSGSARASTSALSAALEVVRRDVLPLTCRPSGDGSPSSLYHHGSHGSSPMDSIAKRVASANSSSVSGSASV
jgi:hypothetical protein